MTGLEIFTFFVMLVLLVTVGALVWDVGSLPGKIARSRTHPQADAVEVCGWLGILTLGLAWPVALACGTGLGLPPRQPGQRNRSTCGGTWDRGTGKPCFGPNREAGRS